MACNAFAVLVVTDGTTRIDLLNCGRWMLAAWEPFIPGAKGGGTWQDSPLSPGRQLIDYQRTNWIDVFTLTLQQPTQDGVIFQEQELLRLMEKAIQYWTSRWQNEPVWIEAKAALETNTRYAVIKSYGTPSGSGNPFGQPFILPEPKSVIEDFELTIEHGPWLADEPGTGTCVEISGKQESYPFNLEFVELASDVDCGNNAALDNLPSGGDFTIEAWIRADGWGDGFAGNFARIADKSTGIVTAGWTFFLDPTFGLSALYAYTVTDAYSASGIDDFSADGQWHHVAAVWDNGTATATLYIDGVEPSYTSQTAGVGAYVVDAALDFHIGNRQAAADSAFEGGIGWERLSSNARYVAPFTPPLRCVLPDIDGNTIGQWIGLENSGAPIDNQEGTAALDGTQSDCEFDTNCEQGRDETCGEEVYIGNKHNRAQLTHIFVDDGGAFGGNLFGAATPFDLLPAVPVANDAVYFGIDVAFDDSGPFASLVLDIGTVITGVTGLAWEYWNGAWVALTVQDNTDAGGAMTGIAFDTAGVESVHWEQPSNWATTPINGVTGYWVRARVTVAAGATTPTQQNRTIYSILWPYVEIAADQVPGDIVLALRAIEKNQSGNTGTTVDLIDNRLIFGLRSVRRGERYTPFINIADEQNELDILITAGTNAAFATDIRSPSGRVILYTPVGVEALARRVRIVFASTLTQLSAQYAGVFHAYVRVTQTNGAAGDFGFQLQITADALPTILTDTVFTQLAGGGAFEYEVLDFGQIALPGYALPDGYIPDILAIDIFASAAAAGGRTLAFIDLILMPVDEWSATIVDLIGSASPGSAITSGGEKDYLDLDAISYPRDVLSFIRQDDDDVIKTKYRQILVNGPHLQSNSRQRMWIFSNYYPTTGAIFAGRAANAHTVVFTGNARYLYARGAR